MKLHRPLIAMAAAVALFLVYKWDVNRVERLALAEIQSGQVLFQDPSNAIAIEFQEGESLIRLERSDRTERWRIVAPEELPAADAVVNAYLENMRGAKRQARFPATSLEQYGLADPRRSVTLTMRTSSGEETRILHFGTQLGDLGNVYTMLEDEDEVFTVSEWFFRQSGKTLESLRDRSLSRTDIARATSIRIDSPRHDFSVERRDATSSEWALVQPERRPIPADRNIVERNILSLTQGQFVRVFDDLTSTTAQLGLDEPPAKVFVDGTEVLRIGLPISEQQQFYAQSGSGEIGIVAAAQMQDFFRAPLEWGTKRLVWMPREEMAEIETRSGGNRMLLMKSGEEWIFPDAPDALIRNDSLEALITGIQSLSAIQLVSADPSELDMDRFGFREEGFSLIVRSADGREQGFRFGQTDSREGVTFTLRLQDNTLWRIDFLGQRSVFKFRGDLLDRRIEPRLVERTARFEVETAQEGAMVVEKKGSAWSATLPGGRPVTMMPVAILRFLEAVQDMEAESEMFGGGRPEPGLTVRLYEEGSNTPFLEFSEVRRTRTGTLFAIDGKLVEVANEQYDLFVLELEALVRSVLETGRGTTP